LRASKVEIVPSVKIEAFYHGRSAGFKYYHTAKSAARAWAQNMSATINGQRHKHAKLTGTKYVPADGYSIVIVGTTPTVPTSHFPVYETAYRRSLKIFKKILP
jgi:coproporphyrinogen III oxidase